MEQNDFKISVVIPTYNRSDVLCRAIDSILNQNFKSFEIIIVDDGSTDKTKENLIPYLQKFQNIKYFYENHSGNPGNARNFGITKAVGKYISFLDSDDWYLPGRLEKMFDFAEHNQFDWVVCSTYRCDEGAEDSLILLNMDNIYLDESKTKINLLKHGLFSFSSMHIFPGAVLVKKECFDKVGLFDPSYFVGEDSDMWLRFSEFGLKAGYFDEPLYVYFKNKTSITQRGTLGLDDNIRLAKKHLSLIPVDKKLLNKSYSDFLWEYAQKYYFRRKRITAIILVIKSFIIFPEVSKIQKVFRNLKKIFGYK